ncbi:hypothetical protein GX50_05180 [[Emmonsia] crescens]|uniref:Uncharacterized protein n=1 Tax=[Emmonsia] crescens TaxID=73230 RepID=A0A2B7ZEN3_9EURO|nr:hypothetical protein GX50_05180 [Emmonsia crescens]
MTRLSLTDIAAAKDNQETPWINGMQAYGIPITSPFEETISEDTIVIFSICNYVESAGSKCPVLSTNPPNPESGEPNPSIDYNGLSQFIISNKGRIAPGDIAIFQELARRRRSYFGAYDLLFKADNTLRDLFAERCQLLKRSQAIAQNPDNFTIESRRDISSRVEINVRNCVAEKEIHAACLQGITTCTARLAGIKHITLSVFQKIRDKKSKSQHQRQKTSNGMNTGTGTRNRGGSGALNKTHTPSPMPQPAKLIGNNGITKTRTHPLQPAGLAGNKTTREYQSTCIAVDRLNKGFEYNVPRPYHIPITIPTTRTPTSAPSICLAELGQTTPPDSSPLQFVTENF